MTTKLTVDTRDGTIKFNNVPLSYYPMAITTEEAVLHLQKVLREDDEYRYGWQSNIAMAFYDEYQKQRSLGYTIEDHNIHEIANKAANRFLDILMINIDKV